MSRALPASSASLPRDASAGVTLSRASRPASYFARSGWKHLLLLSGAAIFLFPFLWMVLTSVKTDEEIAAGGWWPTVPHFRQRSPYALPPVQVHRPAYIPQGEWAQTLPSLQALCAAEFRRGLNHHRLLQGRITWDADDRALEASAAATLLDRLAPKISESDWRAGPAARERALSALITPQALVAAVEDRLASLDLLGLQVRTLDAQITDVFTAADIGPRWTVSGPAALAQRGTLSFLRYDFSSTAQPVTLRATFDLPCRPDQLHKLILALRPDDSWHRLDATLEVDDGPDRITYRSTRPTYLAQHRPMSVIFQPSGYDDTTLQPKTWVPMKEQRVSGFGDRVSGEEKPAPATAPSSPLRRTRTPDPGTRSFPATLTLTITPSSTLAASWAKATRNYARAFYAVPFWRYVANSLLLVALTTLGTLFSSTFVAYAFARLRWPGRSAAFVLLLATMMLPAQVTVIPQFLIWKSLGWYNTLNPLWFGAFFGTAFFIFLMTQHMKTIPRELEESARVDGLNAVQTWYYIILPQVKPAAAAVAVMTFMWSWNEFLAPLIYLRDQQKFPLSLGLFALRLENFGDWSLIMAANVLMTVPVMVLFFLCQKYFVQGMTMSGMK